MAQKTFFPMEFPVMFLTIVGVVACPTHAEGNQ
jgi:hypothetical protein